MSKLQETIIAHCQNPWVGDANPVREVLLKSAFERQPVPIYQALARTIGAYKRCVAGKNEDWIYKHQDRIERIVKNYLPSGGGFDSGTKLDIERSDEDGRLVFTTSFHHMNDGGFYDGWTDHEVIVTPTLGFDISLRITGRDRHSIKDYIHEMFQQVLSQEIDEYGDK